MTKVNSDDDKFLRMCHPKDTVFDDDINNDDDNNDTYYEVLKMIMENSASLLRAGF